MDYPVNITSPFKHVFRNIRSCITDILCLEDILGGHNFERANSEPIKLTYLKRRWMYLGHVLRLPPTKSRRCTGNRPEHGKQAAKRKPTDKPSPEKLVQCKHMLTGYLDSLLIGLFRFSCIFLLSPPHNDNMPVSLKTMALHVYVPLSS